MKKSFTILFDFKNEAMNIKEMMKRLNNIFIDQKFNNYEKHIFFINDQSTDNSKSIIETCKIKYNNTFNIILYDTPKIWGRDTCKLFAFKNIDTDFLVHLDCDLQDPPELIPQLISEWEKGNKIVYTVRNKRLGENKLKLFLTFIAYRVVKLVSGSKRPLDSGDFTLIDKEIYKKISKINQFEPYIKGLLGLLNVKNNYVNYKRDARYTGNTKYPLYSSLNPYKELCRASIMYSKRIVPIYFLFSFFFFLLSCGYILFNGINLNLKTLMVVFFNIVLFGLLIFLVKNDEKFQKEILFENIND